MYERSETVRQGWLRMIGGPYDNHQIPISVSEVPYGVRGMRCHA